MKSNFGYIDAQIYIPLHKIRLVQEQLLTVDNGCWCPYIVGISYVNLYETKYKYEPPCGPFY